MKDGVLMIIRIYAKVSLNKQLCNLIKIQKE